MKKLLRAAAAVSAAALTLTFTVPAASVKKDTQMNANAAVDDCSDDWLHAKGSRLYDKNGNEVWLYKVVGAPHCWHNGDINTGEEIWKFFSKYIKP